MKKIYLIILLAFVSLLTMNSCKKQSLAEKVHQIEKGMSLDDIVKILGNHTSENEQNTEDGIIAVITTDDGDDGCGGQRSQFTKYRVWEIPNVEKKDVLDVFSLTLDSCDDYKNTVAFNEMTIEHINQYIEQKVVSGSETEKNLKEEYEKNRPCISCFDAKESVKRWALIKQAEGISISYASSSWDCRETKSGCYVKATFYMSSQQVDREFFIDCNGNVN
jgi:hypothetical protein